MVNNCSLPEIIEIKTSLLPSGDGNGSKFCAWVICTGIEIALSAAAAACSDASEIASRTEKKVRRRREELRREVTIALVAIKLSRTKEVERTKTRKKRTTEKGFFRGHRPELQLATNASASAIPRLRRLFFAGVPERYNQDRFLASPDNAQTPIVPVASVRF